MENIPERWNSEHSSLCKSIRILISTFATPTQAQGHHLIHFFSPGVASLHPLHPLYAFALYYFTFSKKPWKIGKNLSIRRREFKIENIYFHKIFLTINCAVMTRLINPSARVERRAARILLSKLWQIEKIEKKKLILISI